ncbi:O-antigen ligase family protein [Thiorhodovibrio litoralis]|uniref:O-antigen ligase family protein n=1 Tax=Thiorhodovibrio litoralis TaxID=2952932 RepID=UPI002B263F30|nr:O-antigen ligase family protein [Thiorhodovibrio litoralis]WPL10853.1 Lipid A core - O-antigen ligase [Thiorhodovibrio litoralis]
MLLESTIELIGVALTPVLVVGIFLRPQILLWYLVLDSWVVIRISQISIFIPALTFNRIMVFVGIIVLVMQKVGARKKAPPSLFTLPSLIMFFFIFYCLFSYYSYAHSINTLLLNNLIFFVLCLFLIESKKNNEVLATVSIIATIVAFLLGGSTLANILINMDLAQRSIAGNRNQTGVYLILCLSFLIPYRMSLGRSQLLARLTVSLAIVVASISVILGLGRMTTFAFIVIMSYFIFRGYISKTTIVVSLFIILLVGLLHGDFLVSFSEKLLRLPSASIEKLDDQQLGALTSGRNVLYEQAWKLYQGNTLFGAGFDKWVYVQEARFGRSTSLHSRWLQILIETGVLGIALYGSLYFFSFGSLGKRSGSRLLRDALGAGLFVFFVAGITDNHGFNDRIFYFIVALIADFSTKRKIPNIRVSTQHLLKGAYMDNPRPR